MKSKDARRPAQDAIGIQQDLVTVLMKPARFLMIHWRVSLTMKNSRATSSENLSSATLSLNGYYWSVSSGAAMAVAMIMSSFRSRQRGKSAALGWGGRTQTEAQTQKPPKSVNLRGFALKEL